MVHLKPVEMDNYYDCLKLKRDDTKYVGNALDVIAEAYIYRETSRAHAIYNDDTAIGLVIIDEERRNKPYRFTDLFIADDYRNKGYGDKAVSAIIDHLIGKNVKTIQIQVHNTNEVAIHIYQKYGFVFKELASWDEGFWVMELELA